MPLYTRLINYADVFNYADETRCFVTLSTLIPYVNTFILSYAKDLSEVEATIPFMPDSDSGIILNPLFDLLHRAPGLELILYDPHDRTGLTSNEFQYLFSLHTGSEWAQYLWYRLNCFSKIELQTVQSTVCHLGITIKEECAEDWMLMKRYESSDGFEEWVERVGLFWWASYIKMEVGE
jgi:hypothetical protein